MAKGFSTVSDPGFNLFVCSNSTNGIFDTIRYLTIMQPGKHCTLHGGIYYKCHFGYLWNNDRSYQLQKN